MGGGCAAWVVVAVLILSSKAEDDHWSRPATPERRAGDWVPLSCANCRPVLDQNVQASEGLPSVLTPPPRAEEARLLRPPPPDGLFQQAATGFLQAYTQQQRKPQQFLQETTAAQSINRPQAQFLKSAGPLQQNSKLPQFIREPSQEFTPPQDPFGQQFDQPYLNQPLLLTPQFLGAPFFPQTNLPQNIQPVNPLQLQPLQPNVLPESQNFQAPADRPLFTQQITAGQDLGAQQGVSQTVAPQQFTANVTDAQKDENEKEEVQLLYVPVEQLNQRARGKQKSLVQNVQQVAQTVGTQSNQFTSPNQAFESSTRAPQLNEQDNYNVQTVTAKNQYNTKQNLQLQQQLPPDDQEKFNSQTHTVTQQFTKQADQFQQQGANQGNFKLDAQNTKQQYNFKLNDQFQPEPQFQADQAGFNAQFDIQQNPQFQPLPNIGNFDQLPVQLQGQNNFNLNGQFQQTQLPQDNFNNQFDLNQQFRAQQVFNAFQQQNVPLRQNINNQQIGFNQNVQLQQFPTNQQFANPTEQPYLNQPIQFDQQIRAQQAPPQQQFQPQQTEAPVTQQQTEVPVAQTTVFDTTTTTEKAKKQRLRTHQQDNTRNVQQNSQFTKKFPQDYQQSSVASNQGINNRPELASQAQDSIVNQQNAWTSTRNSNAFSQQGNVQSQQQYDTQANQFHSGRQQVSSVAPSFSTPAPIRTTPAPNQPPLSVYMETTEESKVNDVLRLLKNAKSIQVLDTIGPESPQVFVGPSNLKPPTGYIKFELPYLNAIDSNRVERKVDKLPFFVAPLNFNPPPGYSKIPFPAPHIGSVVVSNVTVLKNALHDKAYENIPVSSTQRYQEQYTLPPAISPISPQLPSLINSLKEEIYTASTTTNFPSVEPETTTVPYTTPARGRGSSRGSQRATSNYTPPTRRPQQARTRRPYDGRPHSRRVTTTTTTEEPSTEVPVQHFTPQPEQVAFNSETYNVQNTAAPVHDNDYVYLHSGNSDHNIYKEEFLANNFHNKFSNQQQHQTSNSQQGGLVGDVQNFEQYNQNIQVPQGHSLEHAAQTTAVPSVASPNVQSEDFDFKSQKVSGARRDPARQHQRFRGRQRLTTTTTEVYEQPPPAPQEVSHQFNTQTDSNIGFQNNQNSQQHNFNQQHLVENTHFQANVPQNNFNIQTERADVGFQTTERLIPERNEQQQFGHHLNSNNQFNQQTFNQNSQFRQAENYDQVRHAQPNVQTQFEGGFSNEQAPQQNVPVHGHVNQFQQVDSQRGNFDQINSQVSQSDEQQVNFGQSHRFENQGSSQIQQNVDKQQFNQQRHQRVQEQPQHFSNNEQPIRGDQEQVHQSNFGNQFLASGQFGQTFEDTATPQEANIQTTEATTVHQEQDVTQHNQQRLVKYNRPHGRVPVTVGLDTTATDQHLPQVYSTDSTTALDATTKASLVRVRGRVRSRQRGTVRQPTTTEEPNYPTSYLNRQRTSQEREEKEVQDYVPRKRVNYGSQRGSYTTVRNNKETTEQSTTENFDQTEGQSGSVDYTEQSTTTTTESSGKKRYQHILNRNKVRRTRPTDSPSTSGSSGTTRFLRPTTPPPVTRLPSSTRGRIRKPSATKLTTTTEYPEANPTWTERDSFAPSAGSNEIIEPLYQTKAKPQQSFGFQRQQQNIQPKTSPRPASANADEDYWNQGVTIQQSTSFDFKPDASAVTPSSFKENDDQFQGTFSPIWNGQIELQDGNYYDVFNQQMAKQHGDQTPFSSDQQKIVYQDIKNRRPIGKENQYPEKSREVVRETESNDDENVQKVYPVYQEVPKLPQTIEEEMPHEESGQVEEEKKKVYEQENQESFEQNIKSFQNDGSSDIAEQEYKEGAHKRKIVATNSGKKGGRRRGNWVRVRVRKPQDVFETAESQNLAKFSENAIQGDGKNVNNKLSWAPEPITEQPSTSTSTENVNEPAEAITFEQALKDMLKEFITNPDEENQEETETESSTDVPNQTESTSSAEDVREEEEETVNGENIDKGIVNYNTPEEESKSTEEDATNKREVVKTVLPEVTTEVFTQEPTTNFQPVESETTIEPETTTIQNDQINKFPSSRILGTSTTTEISLETEICYRGRCVKTKKLDNPESDLTMSE